MDLISVNVNLYKASIKTLAILIDEMQTLRTQVSEADPHARPLLKMMDSELFVLKRILTGLLQSTEVEIPNLQ